MTPDCGSATVVITSRPVGYRKPLPEAIEAKLQPFDPKRKLRFLRGWLSGIETVDGGTRAHQPRRRPEDPAEGSPSAGAFRESALPHTDGHVVRARRHTGHEPQQTLWADPRSTDQGQTPAAGRARRTTHRASWLGALSTARLRLQHDQRQSRWRASRRERGTPVQKEIRNTPQRASEGRRVEASRGSWVPQGRLEEDRDLRARNRRQRRSGSSGIERSGNPWPPRVCTRSSRQIPKRSSSEQRKSGETKAAGRNPSPCSREPSRIPTP